MPDRLQHTDGGPSFWKRMKRENRDRKRAEAPFAPRSPFGGLSVGFFRFCRKNPKKRGKNGPFFGGSEGKIPAAKKAAENGFWGLTAHSPFFRRFLPLKTAKSARLQRQTGAAGFCGASQAEGTVQNGQEKRSGAVGTADVEDGRVPAAAVYDFHRITAAENSRCMTGYDIEGRAIS